MKHLLPITLLLLTPLIAAGQVTQNVTETVDGKSQYVQLAELTVTPQKPPVPALKYKMTWGFDQRVKNNAAIQYNYAMRELANLRWHQLSDNLERSEEDYRRLFTDPEFFGEKKAQHDAFEKEMLQTLEDDSTKTEWTIRHEASLRYKADAYSFYSGKPISEFPVDDARDFVNRFHNTYRYLVAGSRCDYCDWEYHVRGNQDPWGITIEEVAGCRDLARGLMVKARLEIHDKNYDAAIKTLRVGKTLARHVAEGAPFIVSSFVGISIEGLMNECLLELVQQPDAPNLYWTLTALPESPFSYPYFIELEMDCLRLMCPEIARAMDDPDSMTENDWKNMNNELVKRLGLMSQLYGSSNPSDGSLLRTLPLQSGLLGIAAYPKAKEWLASQGKTSEEIENMPVVQAIGLWSIHRFEIFRDDYLKIVHLPFWQHKENNPDNRWNEFEVMTPLDAMVRMFFPAIDASYGGVCRVKASGDMLRIVEAIRLYAAENDGRLPDSLDAITSVPIPPIDPFTGKPYVYRIENGRGVIEYNPGYGVSRTTIKTK